MSNPQLLHDRLKFMEMGTEVLARLKAMKPMLMAELPSALDAFYSKIQSEPEVSRFFKSAEMIRSAGERQRSHWDRISDGQFDDAFMGAVTKVGEIHARIGLEPRWYIGGYALIVERLISKVVREQWQRRGFGQKDGAEKMAASLATLVKATLLDIDLSISVYLDAAERKRKETEAASRQATIDAVLQAMSGAIEGLAAGDLTQRIGEQIPAEFASLRQGFNAAMDTLEVTLGGIQAAAGVLSAGVDNIAQASDDLARRTEQQAASLVQTAAALTELNNAVKGTASGAAKANVAVGQASRSASESRGVVSEAGNAMGKIEASSQEIGQIIGLIDDIAFQTNLLALNAGVEAARAGDAGRGFAVVASEVRALAQRSAEAAKAIKALISTSSSQVGQGVELVRNTGDALESIVGNVAQIEGLISEIADSAQRQAGGLSEVSEAVNQMNQVVQQNAARVEESTAAAQSLRAESAELGRSVAIFRTGRTKSAGPPPVPAKRRAPAEML